MGTSLYDKDGNELSIDEVLSRIPLHSVNRVEVIDSNGRSYVNWKPDNKTSMELQDSNRTLKVYISNE